MITADPGRRQSVLDEVLAILAREAPPEDRDLLLALSPVVYADMPDAMTLGLSPDAVASRIREYFKFVVRTMPPAHRAAGPKRGAPRRICTMLGRCGEGIRPRPPHDGGAGGESLLT